MKKTKLHKGNFPDPEFYSYIGSYGDWKVYLYRTMNDKGFYRIKVISMKPREKANFYLYFGFDSKHIVNNRVKGLFEQFYPEDAPKIFEIILGYFGRDEQEKFSR